MQVIVEMLPKFQSTHYELTEVVTGLVPKSVGEMHMKEEDAADLSSELFCCSSLNNIRNSLFNVFFFFAKMALSS